MNHTNQHDPVSNTGGNNDNKNNNSSDDDDDDLDADAILAELEADEAKDLSTLRQQKLSSLSSSTQPTTTTTRTTTGGINSNIYTTLTSDDDTLQYTTEHERAIVHFFHPDFTRCTIMDTHLQQIAQRHADHGTANDDDATNVHFARVDVANAEFVVQKLGIRVLPCVIGFLKGQIQGRIVGFEGVSWGGREEGGVVTRAVEERFVEWKVLRRALVKLTEGDESGSENESGEERERGRNGGRRRGITGRKQRVQDDDDDDDWD